MGACITKAVDLALYAQEHFKNVTLETQTYSVNLVDDFVDSEGEVMRGI